MWPKNHSSPCLRAPGPYESKYNPGAPAKQLISLTKTLQGRKHIMIEVILFVSIGYFAGSKGKSILSNWLDT